MEKARTDANQVLAFCSFCQNLFIRFILSKLRARFVSVAFLRPWLTLPSSRPNGFRTGGFDVLTQLKTRSLWILGGFVAIAAALQFANPALTNLPVNPGSDLAATNPPPAEIATLLHAACYDCHSHETQWPWYGHVAPISIWITDHVHDAREGLNFSEWPHDDPLSAAKKWNHVARAVKSGAMPLPSYLLIHPSARLTSAQRQKLAEWAGQEASRLEKGLKP